MKNRDKNNQVVKECEVGPSTSFDLSVEPIKTELVNEDTYDTTIIKIAHIDNHANVMEYSARVLEISTTGPIELVGPTHQALLGGQLSLFIKSKNKVGKASVTIKMDDIIKTIELTVK